MKRLWKLCGFILAAALCFAAAGAWLRPPADEAASMPRDYIDVAFLGTSLSYCAFNTVTLYRDFGVASYNYARQRQMLSLTYYTLKSVFRTQSPKAVVLESYALSFRNRYATDDDPGVATASMEAVESIADRAGMVFSSIPPDQWPMYLLDAVLYHDRWAVPPEAAKAPDAARLCGFVAEFRFGQGVEYDPAVTETELVYDIEPRNLRWLARIARLCRENGAQLLLVKAPLPISVYSVAMSKAAEQAAAELGIPYIDLTARLEELRLDFALDTLDDAHLNAYGAEKATAWIGRYLTDRFDLHDCRGDGDDAWRAALTKYEQLYGEVADETE